MATVTATFYDRERYVAGESHVHGAIVAVRTTDAQVRNAEAILRRDA
jgi:hypothetical protein